MFLQQNGLEMLGKLEHEENEKEKKKNLEEFSTNIKKINEKTLEMKEKMQGLLLQNNFIFIFF